MSYAKSSARRAVDNAAKAKGSDLPMNEAALKASCVVDYLLRAVDDQGAKLPVGLILANIMTVTGAGLTTTSALLTWCLYSLVTYPGVQYSFGACFV
ncbi:hypothetical protein AJ80_01458 [Polytolypa hystricis UAMH7299]|uniref:Uncharacterized protein n=1 Tax=Polytolypa hystricis (strain UAMH7299) TaxID=1447883 RepID=A0A2B7YYX2_POLH7|nr:hypothetical protein AJ80_01458 [Polytolypa hystricis UAMH7299]